MTSHCPSIPFLPLQPSFDLMKQAVGLLSSLPRKRISLRSGLCVAEMENKTFG